MNDLSSMAQITPYGALPCQHHLVPIACSTANMAEDALIRLENLKRLGLDARQLSARLGSGYSYWRDMLKGDKSFGEKVARRIEDGLGLRRGQLDESNEAPEGPWPYELFNHADYMLIPLEYRNRIENELAGEIQRLKKGNGTE